MSVEHTTIGTARDLRDIGEALALIDECIRRAPYRAYRPSDMADGGNRGQLQFHRSTHPVRLLVPGNGWGKSMAMGIEAAWWLDHAHPYRATPRHPIIALWIATEFRQFEMQSKGLLEAKCFARGWKWNENKSRYTWPDGSSLYVASADRDWTYLQGVPVDLVCFDEEPPLKLWRELRQRRRADRQTEFVIGATATRGESWMEQELYRPWLEHHKALGLDEAAAMKAQQHPRIYVHPRGGIEDNPGARTDDVAWYDEARWSSEAERRVRRHGGFGRFGGTSVFDDQAVADALAEAEKTEREGRAVWFESAQTGDEARPSPYGGPATPR